MRCCGYVQAGASSTNRRICGRCKTLSAGDTTSYEAWLASRGMGTQLWLWEWW